MTSDPLSRLRDGLARDAEIARSAAEATLPDWYADGLEEDAEDLQRWQIWAEDEPVAEGTKPVAVHGARHDPARALCMVEKLRAALVLRNEAAESSKGPTYAGRAADNAYSEAFVDGCDAILELLASIYTEDTDETETP